MANEILNPAKYLISADNLPSEFLPANNLAAAVAAALERLDTDRPRAVTYAFTGAGAQALDLSGATGYVDGVSNVNEVYYPWVLGTEDDCELDLDAWRVLQDPTNLDTLFLYEQVPASPNKVLVVFTAPWTEATVPSNLKYKAAKLAAANMCRMIAARMAQSNDSSINVDTFGRNVAAQDWLRMASDFEKEYEKAIGSSKDTAVRFATADGQLLPHDGQPYGRLHPYPADET